MAKAKKRKTEKAPVTPAKAREILKDGTIRGTPLTKQQRLFFGRLAGGAKRVRKPKTKGPNKGSRKA